MDQHAENSKKEGGQARTVKRLEKITGILVKSLQSGVTGILVKKCSEHGPNGQNE
jgi:hypothetical protein